MVYLKSFKLPSEKDEDGVILNTGTHQLNMSCYTDTPYPFKLFPKKQLQSIEFEPVTMFCGSNGSGKSTLAKLLNLVLTPDSGELCLMNWALSALKSTFSTLSAKS